MRSEKKITLKIKRMNCPHFFFLSRFHLRTNGPEKNGKLVDGVGNGTVGLFMWWFTKENEVRKMFFNFFTMHEAFCLFVFILIILFFYQQINK